MDKVMEKEFVAIENRDVLCIKFSPDGNFLVLSTKFGHLKVYETKFYSELQGFKSKPNIQGNINNIAFSFDSKYLSVSQGKRISVYVYTQRNNKENKHILEWKLLGNYESHLEDITHVYFAEPSGLDSVDMRKHPRLFSIGLDNILNEYNLVNSTFNTGLLIGHTTRVDVRGMITTLQFIPGIELNDNNIYSVIMKDDDMDNIEDRLVICTDEFKFYHYCCNREIWTNHDNITDDEESMANKENNEETKEIIKFRKCTLAPSYTSPLNKIIKIKRNGEYIDKCVFSTFDQDIGIMLYKNNGIPSQYFGILSHPGHIKGFDITFDSKYIITCGGTDKTFCLWNIHDKLLDKQINESKKGMNAYIELLNSIDETLYNHIENYFYYIQIQKYVYIYICLNIYIFHIK